MKKMIMLGLMLTLLKLNTVAQMETGILPAEGSQPGQFTEWKKVEFTSGSETLTYEYRVAFTKRKALACYYEVQLKNTSAKKIKIELRSHYYDKLVKGNYGDKFKETVKPGKDVAFLVITQGCKADKDKKDLPDIERCRNCDFSYEIYPSAD